MIRNFTIVFAWVLFPIISASAQNVHVPDSNFKSYLLSQPSINKNGDGEIQVTEARQVVALNVSGKNIADLTGIREFTGLRELQCNNNSLTSLDLRDIQWLRLLYARGNRLTSVNISGNSVLQYLDLRANQLATLDFGTNTKLYKANLENNLLMSLDVTAQPDLAELIISHNRLTSLNVSGNQRLQTLICAHNSLQSLNVASNSLLIKLHVYNNTLTSLNLGSNPNLNSLRCNHNQLTSLDVSSNTGLVELRAYVNRLTSLNLGANTNLIELMAFQNQLPSLNVNGLSALRTLQVQFNKIDALDLKENRALATVDLRKNLLRTLDMRNGNNRNITSFDVTFNPPLTCIAVDDPAWSTANWPKHDYSAEYELSCGECDGLVYIPDPNFRNALVTDYEINTNMDGVIQYCEAEAHTGIINVQHLNIQDMTGIEAFTQISSLNCASNQITSLDLGPKARIGAVDCHENPIKTLVVNQAATLTSLIGYSCQFTELNLSNNPELLVLDIHFVNIPSIDVSANPKLRVLNLYVTLIGSLDLSNNPELTDLNISNTNLTFDRQIDLSHNPELGVLNASGLFRRTLDLSANTKLYDVDVSGNEIPYLDFSHHPRLERLRAGENGSLWGMNLKGVNILDFGEFSTIDANHLECIEVDNVEDAERVWRDNVEPGTAFSTDCGEPSVINIPDPNFKAALLANANLNTNGDDEIQFVEADSYSGDILVPGRDIHDMTGIEHFPFLRHLNCSGNAITTLDVSKADWLFSMNCSNNQLTSLNFASTSPNLGPGDFEARGNSNLTCIQVLDVAYAQQTWSNNIDPQASFSEDCESGSAGGRLSAWPNPSSGKFVIEGGGTVGKSQVYDFTGGLVSEHSGVNIDISGVRAGTYFIKVKQGEKLSVVRVVKE